MCKMRELGLPILVQVYYLQSDSVMSNEEVRKYVPDAEYTGEMWITKAPKKVYHRTYEIIDFLAPKRTDMFGVEGHFVMLIDTIRVKRRKNIDNFIEALYLSEMQANEFKGLIQKISFRSMMEVLNKTDIAQLKKNIAKIEENKNQLFQQTA